jgi:hypothetical protein
VSNDERDSAAVTYVTETKYDPVTKHPLVSFTYLNGLLQATPDDEPSYVLYDEQGRPKLMEWHDQGEVHREGVGAVIEIDPDTNVHTFEDFYANGRPRERALGPCRIVRDRITGEITRELFEGDSLFPPEPGPPEFR